MTLYSLLTKYIKEKSLYVAEGTVSFYKSRLPSLYSFFDKKTDVSKIDKDRVLSYIKARQAVKISNNTINHDIGFLKAAYRFYGINADFLSLRKLNIEFITYGFLDTFKQKTISPIIDDLDLCYRTVISVFLDTGVRLSELINIELSNVDFENRSIFLKKTKTHRTRYVFFTSETSNLLKLYLSKRKRPNKLLFLNTKKKKFTVGCIESAFRRIRLKYGFTKFSPHMLRHTLATNLYNDKADLIFIETIMGHSNTETTKRYIHTDVESNRNRYDRFKKTTLNKAK
ncbi:MAG: tyrosine-type recombinase/integrase [Bacilli bacterium]|nr:tyrosine-type recombinase/integrase [Bacilli bacterium]